jgi:hypothetical protein
MLRRKDLRKRIDRVIKDQTEKQQNVFIDYTRNVFYSRELQAQKLEREYGNNDRDYIKSKMSKIRFQMFVGGVDRLLQYLSFQRQKEGKIQELIRQLRRQNSGVIKNEARKTEKVIEEQTPIMKQKIQSLVIK